MDSSTTLNSASPEIADGKDDVDGEEELVLQPFPAHERLEVDSSYGDDVGSVINYRSVTESIYNFRVENGRTYHAYSDGKYYVPNDEEEQYRMDVVYHSILRMFDGKSFFAPLKNPQRIVDMGTGTGIWALDVGDQYPSAHVVGIDLSPIQPKWVAPNVEFRIDDIDLPWVFEKPIDLIHSCICSGIAIRDWPRYLSESYRCLRPGGWVEAQEFYLEAMSDDDSFPPDSAIVQWHDKFYEGMLLGGGNVRISSRELKRYMEDAGFINVQTVDLKWPMSPWSEDPKLKEAGEFVKMSIMDNMSGMSLAVFTRLLGWSIADLEALLARVAEEFEREDIHGYWPLFSVYGQKPMDS